MLMPHDPPPPMRLQLRSLQHIADDIWRACIAWERSGHRSFEFIIREGDWLNFEEFRDLVWSHTGRWLVPRKGRNPDAPTAEEWEREYEFALYWGECTHNCVA